VLTVWVAITGALHLDGFLDACDGLFGGHTPESRLEILRDVHVGAFGVVGAVMLLLIKLAALVSLPVSRHIAALFLAPTLGRWGMTLAVVFFPYARPKGLGRAMKDHAGRRQAVLATAMALAVAWFAGEWLGLAAVALAGVTTWAVARFVLGRLPGLTGDIYGAICETIEVVVLLFFAAEVGL
jgi:adenosylcobinamide-GDP ribazoletransferase